jgi:hypothetical protein
MDARAPYAATIVGGETMSDVEKQIEQWRVDLGGSELLGHSDIKELESHLREEMEHLKTSGLSDEETFLVARRRLGDTATLEEEFAKVNAHRRLANRSYWMILGLLSWFVVWPLVDHLSTVSAYLAYTLGLRGTFLLSFTLVTAMTTYALVGFLMLRYLASRWHSRVMAKRVFTPICVGLFAAGANYLLCWTVNFADHHIWQRAIPPEAYRQITSPNTYTAWYIMMMFLFAGALAIFARQSKEHAEVP